MVSAVWVRDIFTSILHPGSYCGISHQTVGAPIAGRISDWQVTRWRKRRGGKWVPEDLLRGLWFGAAIAAPISVLCFGLVTKYVDGPLGIVLDLVCLFFNGMGVSSSVFKSAVVSAVSIADLPHRRLTWCLDPSRRIM